MTAPSRLSLITPLALILAACGAPSAPVGGNAAAPAAEGMVKGVSLELVAPAEQPWGMAFLPDGGLLFTEKEGGLKFFAAGSAPAPVSGLPEAYVEGQAGYLGIALDPDFASNRLVYVSISTGTAAANSTAVFRGSLTADNSALENVQQIFKADDRDTAYHYGSRLVFGKDGKLFVSLGEGFKYKDDAQNPQNTHGTIVRINPDGSVPADNPFADGVDGKPEVWSYGHRNVQGLYYDAETDTLWETEHGPKGGDELNIIQPGVNYGWPKITYGVNYDGTIITNDTKAEGLAQPEIFWVPSIAPAGLTKLTSDKYPGWEGDLFAGGMNGPAGLVLVRIDLEDGKAIGKEDLLKDEMPIRDVVQGPDGYLYVANKDFDGIFRVVPNE
ncbi:PQQ-dependent sugar dehydrogenase [Hyphomonas sp. WL0036]|uniref:PQQ-dependent sugar dehydrogenase n=1 Tax=Hyphomonas sediminis TaxID=2866160 RepID=UPI001C7E6F71|nr:PQQ-dependent sugar dehydrogenase [Hyphomonas sediminis]MBY9065492.1 PQQ-dependent sugar dehydrogenase [Hyphomonas sediminis]